MGAQPISGEAPWRRSRQVVRLADPAAGSDWLATVPAGHVWLLEAIGARLITSATVMSRVPNLTVGDGVGTVLEIAPAGPVGAGETKRLAWLPDVGAIDALGGGVAPLPRIALGPGWTVGTTTLGLQAGDTWTQVRIVVVDLTVRAGPVDLGLVPELRVEVVAPAEAGGGGGGG
ncbi:MAG TPA: hypothetical protein VNJ28_04675 [Candidatus Limnocylindrales bacterium]|nr:hypothetical protein [Candidatus Limnocylindrales bacterium]